MKNGPSGETRTRGILVPNQAPYQLGHTRILKGFLVLITELSSDPMVMLEVQLACRTVLFLGFTDYNHRRFLQLEDLCTYVHWTR